MGLCNFFFVYTTKIKALEIVLFFRIWPPLNLLPKNCSWVEKYCRVVPSRPFCSHPNYAHDMERVPSVRSAESCLEFLFNLRMLKRSITCLLLY